MATILVKEALKKGSYACVLRKRGINSPELWSTRHFSNRTPEENYDPVLAEVKDPNHPYPGVAPVKGPQLDPKTKGDCPDDERGDELHWAEPKEYTMKKAEEKIKETWETGALKDLRTIEEFVTKVTHGCHTDDLSISSLTAFPMGTGVLSKSTLLSQHMLGRELLYPPSSKEDIGFVDEEVWAGEHIGSEDRNKTEESQKIEESQGSQREMLENSIKVVEERDEDGRAWVWWSQKRSGFSGHFGVYLKGYRVEKENISLGVDRTRKKDFP